MYLLIIHTASAPIPARNVDHSIVRFAAKSGEMVLASGVTIVSNSGGHTTEAGRE